MADVTTLQHWLDMSDDVAESVADALEDCLAAARHRLEDRVIPSAIGTAPVEQAIVLYAEALPQAQHSRGSGPDGRVRLQGPCR